MEKTKKQQCEDYLNGVLENIDETLLQIEKLEKTISRCYNRLITDQCAIEGLTSDDLLEDILKVTDNYERELIKASRQFYSISRESNYSKFRFGNSKLSECEQYAELVSATLGIDVFAKDNIVFARTPLLEKRAKCFSEKIASRIYCNSHNSLISDVVLDKLMSVIRAGEIEDIEFRSKNVKFLISQNAEKRNGNISDLDSFDIAPVLDAVAVILGGDSAFNCSLSIGGICDGSLPEGTYICVTPEWKDVISDERIVQIWEARLKENPVTEQDKKPQLSS